MRQIKYLMKAELLWANLRQTKYLIKAELLWANLRQIKYLIKAEHLWANLRQTKYWIKAELLWANLSWAELVLPLIQRLGRLHTDLQNHHFQIHSRTKCTPPSLEVLAELWQSWLINCLCLPGGEPPQQTSRTVPGDRLAGLPSDPVRHRLMAEVTPLKK